MVIFVNHTEGDPQSKFNTCKHRSNEQFKANVHASCCGKTKSIEAFKCIKRNIFPLQSNICDNCEVFEIKN